ncbi:MAG: carboxypeptidase-like regulatory domain-containing protein [Chthoniobacter sp.]|nr:carboxypeptidase-like regulatory domain-containing protein [Chthoniobacter sp.]
MSRNRALTLAILIGAAALVFILSTGRKDKVVNGVTTMEPTAPLVISRQPGLSSGTPAPLPLRTEPQREKAKIVEAIFNAPINFWGKVIDQFGDPIEGAKIKYGAIDKFWANGSSYDGQSDAAGYFSITGIQGAGLTVGVNKEGYDGVKGKSYQAFGYGMGPDSSRAAPPTKVNPAIFVLRKKKDAEALFVIDCDVRVPRNGTPVEVSLRTGKPVAAGDGDLKIECWTMEQSKDAKGHYDWRCRFSVPGGGLAVRREADSSFEAPENGYEESIEINMPQTSEAWRSDRDGQYWFKLRDGTFGRGRLRISTDVEHFVSITSYLNPNPNSRNLEYDPKKQIVSPQ